MENNFFVDIPMGDDDNLLEIDKRVCTCGHTLTMHAFTMVAGGLRTSQCISCKCEKFEWSGKIKEE